MKNTILQGMRRGGFTLLEMSISVVLLGLMLSSVALLSSATESAFHTGTLRNHVESRAVAALQQVVTELRIAVVDSVDLGDGQASDRIEFVQAVGLLGTDVQFSPLRRVSFEYEVGELDDGIDNNGNGLVDEGRILLTDNPGGPTERSRVICRWVRELADGELDNGLDDDGDGLVDEPGFQLQRSGETLLVRLTLERMSGEGRPLRRTARSSVRLRN